ncbi:MAG TPA: type II toxin-antitoxin system PemK/MazF family toxin [Rhizomicrobium sp.]|jgi:mRNA interferase MazF|nr:type II toxin-antitoxin system PemK/MazF family toxin [Rhizomicrobium sp.]
MSAPSNRSDAFSPFDVVIVPFPYADRLAEKRRPAVVVSAPELSRKYGLVWLVMVTSADNRAWDCDVTVGDLKVAGLPAPSLIRPAKLATVDAARILRRIGHLSAKDARALGAELKTLFG